MAGVVNRPIDPRMFFPIHESRDAFPVLQSGTCHLHFRESALLSARRASAGGVDLVPALRLHDRCKVSAEAPVLHNSFRLDQLLVSLWKRTYQGYNEIFFLNRKSKAVLNQKRLISIIFVGIMLSFV